MNKLHDDIMDLLRDRMENDADSYINPNFMLIVTGAISDYYEVEDNSVEQWIVDMFGM